MSKRISAIFNDEYRACEAIYNLKDIGFGDSDFSVLVLEEDKMNEMDIKSLEAKHGPESAYKGAKVGAAVGAGLTGLTSLGALSVAGGLGVLAAGPLAISLLGVGAAAGAGGLVGSLIGVGLSEHEAKAIDQHLVDGKVILSFSVSDKKEDSSLEALEKAKVERYMVN